jgi:hypothetical protein
MIVIEIIGNLRSRFIQVVVLLRMLNLVRDDPTIHDLDQDLHNIDISRERLLKRKFLDFFALICVTKKDDDSVLATCMEESASQGIVLRIASNSEVGERTLGQLRELVDTLNSIGSGDTILSIPITEHRLIVELISLFPSSRRIWRRSQGFS